MWYLNNDNIVMEDIYARICNIKDKCNDKTILDVSRLIKKLYDVDKLLFKYIDVIDDGVCFKYNKEDIDLTLKFYNNGSGILEISISGVVDDIIDLDIDRVELSYRLVSKIFKLWR